MKRIKQQPEPWQKEDLSELVEIVLELKKLEEQPATKEAA